MSIDIAEEKRTFLNSKLGEPDFATKVAARYPDCACETASKTPNGHGPVDRCELVLFFVTFPYHFKKKPTKHNGHACLSKALGRGLSLIRMDKVDDEEFQFSVDKTYQIITEDKGDKAGIMGVYEFPACIARLSDRPEARFCILDTPNDNEKCHADLVYSMATFSQEDRKKILLSLFNIIGGKNGWIKAKDFQKFDLSAYLPQVCKDDPGACD